MLLLRALMAALLLVLIVSPLAAQGVSVVLLEDIELTDNRLHYPVVISDGRGYRIRCNSQGDEEAVIRGLGFTTVPSTVLTAFDPQIEAAAPLENPLLCPSSSEYPIKVFAHNGPDGLTHYLQFPDGLGSTAFTNSIYIPGCAGLVESLALDLDAALNADPTPFFAGKIHEIKCLVGDPIPTEPTTFAEWCTKTDRTEAETATVMALLDATPGGVSALGDPAACTAAETFVGFVPSLNLGGSGIESTKPISVLTHLNSLTLADNAITDIAPLTKLNALVFLDLSDNAISNIAALAPLVALGNLDLSGNDIDNIRPLASLVALGTLGLSRNNVHELDPLVFLQALTRLSLASNGLTGSMLEPLTGVTTLMELDLSSNEIESFEHLGEFPSTLEIDLSDNPIVASDSLSFADMCILHRDDPTPLGFTIKQMVTQSTAQTCEDAANALNASPTLDLSAKLISDLRPIALLKNLASLNLSGNAITDVTPLAALAGLSVLDLSNNNITDIRPIAPLVNLTSFNAAENPIDVSDYLSACLIRAHEGMLSDMQAREVEALFNATSAETCFKSTRQLSQQRRLTIVGKDLQSVDYFSILAQVQRLNLTNNSLSNVSALRALPHLTHLTLQSNQIGSIAVLGGLTRLQVLDLDQNPISTLSGIGSYRALRELYFSSTNVTIVHQIAQLPEFERAGMRSLSLNYHNLEEYCLVHKFDSFALGAERQFMVALESRLASDNIDQGDCNAVETWARNLRSLNLNKKNLTSVKPVRFFSELRELHLFDNRIADAGPILNLRRLEKLSLAKNRLQSVPRFRSSGLRTLYLNQNMLANIKNLNNLGNLRTLRLDANRITHANALSGLNKITYLDLRNNRIRRFNAVSGVLGKKLYLKGNPICPSGPVAAIIQVRQACEREIRLRFMLGRPAIFGTVGGLTIENRNLGRNGPLIRLNPGITPMIPLIIPNP